MFAFGALSCMTTILLLLGDELLKAVLSVNDKSILSLEEKEKINNTKDITRRKKGGVSTCIT